MIRRTFSASLGLPVICLPWGAIRSTEPLFAIKYEKIIARTALCFICCCISKASLASFRTTLTDFCVVINHSGSWACSARIALKIKIMWSIWTSRSANLLSEVNCEIRGSASQALNFPLIRSLLTRWAIIRTCFTRIFSLILIEIWSTTYAIQNLIIKDGGRITIDSTFSISCIVLSSIPARDAIFIANIRDISIDPKSAILTIFRAWRASLHSLVREGLIPARHASSSWWVKILTESVTLIPAHLSWVIQSHVRATTRANHSPITIALPASQTITRAWLTWEAGVIEPVTQGTCTIKHTLGSIN